MRVEEREDIGHAGADHAVVSHKGKSTTDCPIRDVRTEPHYIRYSWYVFTSERQQRSATLAFV